MIVVATSLAVLAMVSAGGLQAPAPIPQPADAWPYVYTGHVLPPPQEISYSDQVWPVADAAAKQALILRVAEAYFGVLSARENLVFAEAEKKAIARQLEQAKERFEVGLVAITDVHEAQTGQRIEGVFFGALSFGRKAATGLGGLAAGLLLTAIDFPEQATPGTIEARTVAALGIAAGPGAGILVLIALAMGWRYPLTRAQHRQLQSSLTRELRSDAQDGAPDPPGS